MHTSIVLLLLAPFHLISATPAATRDAAPRDVDIFNDALLLDSAAFASASSTSNTTTANFRVNTFWRQPESDLDSIINGTSIPQLLDLVPGVDVVGRRLTTFVSRIKPFLAVPSGGREVVVHVPACKRDEGIKLGQSGELQGLLESDADLGKCSFDKQNTAEGIIKASDLLNLEFDDVKNTIFFSPPAGWGVISDVDDTIKNSSTSDTGQLIAKTLLEPHAPITNMPQVFEALSSSLSGPDEPAQFIYLTGSPLQLYPSIRPFIHDTYPPGPLIVRNYTFRDIPSLARDADDSTRDYKVGELRKIHDWYPNKKYLLIGDSSQKDAEAYAAAFHEFGDGWAGCVWIRAVQGGNNSQERFEEAFEGVPRGRWRVFTDPVADGLMDVDVAGGSC